MNVKHELCCVAEPSGVTIAVGKNCYLVNEDRQLASAPDSVSGCVGCGGGSRSAASNSSRLLSLRSFTLQERYPM